MIKQLGVAPSNPEDAATKGYVDALIPTEIYVYRTTNSSSKTNTTMANDSELSCTLGAGTWLFELNLMFDGTDTSDCKIGLTHSGTATGQYMATGVATGATNEAAASMKFNGSQTFTTVFVSGTVGGAISPLFVKGRMEVSVSGTFRVQWAENTTDATGLILLEGSWMKFTKVA